MARVGEDRHGVGDEGDEGHPEQLPSGDDPSAGEEHQKGQKDHQAEGLLGGERDPTGETGDGQQVLSLELVVLHQVGRGDAEEHGDDGELRGRLEHDPAVEADHQGIDGDQQSGHHRGRPMGHPVDQQEGHDAGRRAEHRVELS